jgi:hypothetical protein
MPALCEGVYSTVVRSALEKHDTNVTQRNIALKDA